MTTAAMPAGSATTGGSNFQHARSGLSIEQNSKGTARELAMQRGGADGRCKNEDGVRFCEMQADLAQYK